MKSFLFIGLASGNIRISKTVTESGYGLAMPVKGGRNPQIQYLKDWRKRNPHYHRDWMRQSRNSRKPWGDGRKFPRILGVRVQVNLLERIL